MGDPLAYMPGAPYVPGQLVVAPDGSIQTPKAVIASASSPFNPAAWTVMGTGLSAYGHIPAPPVPRTPISLLQSGHGWTSSGGPGTLTDDSANCVIGTQSLKLVTDGASGSCVMDSGAITPIDLSTRVIRLTYQVTGFAHYNGVWFYAGDATLANYSFVVIPTPAPVIWSHDGEWVTITLHPSDFTVGAGALNWAAVSRFRLRAVDTAGGSMTVNLNEVSYQPQPSAGVVSLEFDDGYVGTATKAAPILAQYGFPANVWIIRDFIDTNNPSFMTLNQVRSLQEFNQWEIGAHASTGTAHNNWATISDAACEDELAQIKSWLIHNGFRGHDHFVWPEGQFTTTKLAIARKYFSTARTIFQAYQENYPVGDWMRLRGYLPGNTSTVATLNGVIDQALARKQWLRLVFHSITDTPSVSTEYLTSNFASVMAHLASTGASVRTVGDVYARGIS